MGILTKLLKREAIEERLESETCTHLALTPRWDDIDAIGHEDLASSFRCESCGRVFNAGEVRELRRNEAERVRRLSG
jgi:hypothetical protein